MAEAESTGRGGARKGGGRGSDELVRKYGKVRHLRDVDLGRILSVLQDAGDVLDYFPKGQPAPDWVEGSVRLKANGVGKLMQQLMELEGVRIRGLVGFPYGLPALDEFIVK